MAGHPDPEISVWKRKMSKHGPGRKEPYTQIGIARVPCIKCGKPARTQFQICADDRLYRPLCLCCDRDLNRLVLKFMQFPDAEEKMAAYEKKLIKLYGELA
jgi:hypothetical protein